MVFNELQEMGVGKLHVEEAGARINFLGLF